MRALPVMLVAMLALMMMAPVAAQTGEDENEETFRGLWLSTPYPAVEVAPGDTVGFDLTVHNAGLPPQRVALSLVEVPEGWTARLTGGGRPVRAAFVGPDDSARVRVEMEPPDEVEKADYRFVVRAEGDAGRFDLPLEVTVGETPPAELVLDPELPVLPGTPDTTFTFKVALENKTGEDALIALRAEAPSGFQVSFTEEFGTQKLTSVPVEAGQSEGLEVEVRPPQGIEAGRYAVTVRAAAGDLEAASELTLEVSGQPELRLSAPGGRLSGQAYAGEETPLTLIIENTGSAPAQGVSFSAFEPQGWTVEFEPERLDLLPPGEIGELEARVTPPAQAIAGDYMITLRANSNDASDSSEFRITVRTSTLWGAVGIAVIAAAVVVLALAVVRYGRR